MPPEDDAPGLAARLRELHPYDTPEIVTVAIVDGDPDYLRWIADSVGDSGAGAMDAGS